jgi:hypothetical protein
MLDFAGPSVHRPHPSYSLFDLSLKVSGPRD